MHIVNKLGYLVFGVTDLDEAMDFYARFVRLSLSDRIGRTAFMTGGLDHHWLRLEEGSAGAKRIGYEVAGEEALGEVRRRLDERGIAYEEGGDFRTERVQRWLRFTDPGGFEIDLYTGMAERPVAPMGAGVNLVKFLHSGVMVRNFDDTTRFYQEVLGFKPSDWYGDMAGFFRCADRYHHSLAMIRAMDGTPTFDHFCIEVGSIDDVMRFRHNAVSAGVGLRFDILRHAPSGSISVYIKDDARGIAVEYCTGHARVDDETHRPRVLPVTLDSLDVWRAALPEPCLREPAGLEELNQGSPATAGPTAAVPGRPDTLDHLEDQSAATTPIPDNARAAG